MNQTKLKHQVEMLLDKEQWGVLATFNDKQLALSYIAQREGRENNRVLYRICEIGVGKIY